MSSGQDRLSYAMMYAFSSNQIMIIKRNFNKTLERFWILPRKFVDKDKNVYWVFWQKVVLAPTPGSWSVVKIPDCPEFYYSPSDYWLGVFGLLCAGLIVFGSSFLMCIL